MKNRILAIEAAPAAIPVNPNIADTIATNKNITTHLNIIHSISYYKIRLYIIHAGISHIFYRLIIFHL